MAVGPLLDEETHDAILETRKRRKDAAQQGAAKRTGKRSEGSGSSSGKSQSEG